MEIMGLDKREASRKTEMSRNDKKGNKLDKLTQNEKTSSKERR